MTSTEPVIIFHEPRLAPFTDAQFYPDGAIATLVDGPRRIIVVVEGDRCLEKGSDTSFRNYEEFREGFPDGSLPEDDGDYQWSSNCWFAFTSDASAKVYLSDHLESEQDYDSAISVAREALKDESLWEK